MKQKAILIFALIVLVFFLLLIVQQPNGVNYAIGDHVAYDMNNDSIADYLCLEPIFGMGGNVDYKLCSYDGRYVKKAPNGRLISQKRPLHYKTLSIPKEYQKKGNRLAIHKRAGKSRLYLEIPIDSTCTRYYDLNVTLPVMSNH